MTAVVILAGVASACGVALERSLVGRSAGGARTEGSPTGLAGVGAG